LRQIEVAIANEKLTPQACREASIVKESAERGCPNGLLAAPSQLIGYEGYLKKWILPRWKSYRLQDVKAVQVEQ